MTDEEVVQQFTNFLSWNVRPKSPADARNVPPAWFAYALGLTRWCPPKGEL